MSVHVPISKEADDEADSLMPSNLLIHPLKIDSLIANIDGESMAGIYLASKEASGREEINKLLPSEYKISSKLNSKQLKKILYRMSVKSKSQNKRSVNGVAKIRR